MELNEPAIAYSKRKYTIEEYLEIEDAAIEKHEYYQGEIFAMSGNKSQHNIVTANIFSNIHRKLGSSPCQPFGSDARIHIEKNSLFTYPDVSVFCGDLISMNNDDLNLLNPTVIFEVLSTSTRNYDREQKFRLYQDIPSLMEYILVEPETIHIEAWRKNDQGTWRLEEYSDISASLQLPHIGIDIALTEIYYRTKIMEWD